jgi:hypothetical protein
MPGNAAACPAEQASGLPLTDASKLVEAAQKALWTPEGKDALEYLRGRGLSDETIKAARLGWTPNASVPIEGGVRYWRVAGVVIPWQDQGRLTLAKIRRLGAFKGPKYIEAYRDRPGICPDPAAIKPGRPLVLCEGELDCLLMAQQLADLASVVTLGSASSKPEGPTYLAMLAAPVWYLAHDADPAGDRAASGWPARALRVRPPAAFKDWTEAAVYGVNLRRWWTDRLGGIEAPVLSTWGELAQRRWGDAIGDPEPGIIIE